MPTLNIRSMVGSARDKFVKVEKVKWAKGNLRANAKDNDAEGWQKGWDVFDEQWKSIFATFKDAINDDEDLSINNDTYKIDNVYSSFDNFSWGNLGRAARVHNQVVTCTTAEFSIVGKVFSGFNSKNSSNISELNELQGEDRFQELELLTATNPSIVGDLAFWASKGQFKMPTRDDIISLYSKSGETSGRANMQAGYYMAGEKKINGVLFTSTPSWHASPSYNSSPIELTDADLESGLFLPKTGMRLKGSSGSATEISHFNAWGGYWCGQFGGINGAGYDDCARHIRFNLTNEMTYGYTGAFSSAIPGKTFVGLAIRPVFIPVSERQ